MKLLIHGRNLELTPALREYTESKISKAIHHFNEVVTEADVHLSVAKNPRVPKQAAEVTVFANGTVIRAEEKSHNLYASIDMVAGKLFRQLRKYKERHKDHHHSTGHSASITPSTEEVLGTKNVSNTLFGKKEVALPDPGIRKKYFEMNPMTIADARRQLDLIDHDFYVFREDSSLQLQVIYKRTHGGYGIIQAKQ